jgi:hypothetical protein
MSDKQTNRSNDMRNHWSESVLKALLWDTRLVYSIKRNLNTRRYK